MITPEEVVVHEFNPDMKKYEERIDAVLRSP
jgi:hypothetical protein